MMRWLKTAAVAVVAMAGAANADVRLQGSGATFPNPLYQKWVTEYQKSNPTVKIDYQSVGSGAGIKSITDQTVDFAGSDAPLSKKEVAAVKGEAVHIPTCAGAVVPMYNVAGVKGDIKFTGAIIADIYLGKIQKWNDTRLKEINPDLDLPNLQITPVYRTDGSGTSFVFTNYLATQSEVFDQTVGTGKQVKWPIGQGGKGSEGVSQAVQSTPGAIGYTEQNYASANKIPYGVVQNKNGKFVKASPASVSAAGSGAVEQMGKTLAVNIWSQAGDEAYPISAFTYVIVYRDLSYMKDQARAKALVDFLAWATTDGQKLAPDMDYAPLAEAVQKKAAEVLGTLVFDGKPLR